MANLVLVKLLCLLIASIIYFAGRYEKVCFDGQRLWREGLTSYFERIFSRQSTSIQIEDVELVSTEAIRSRRLRRVKYCYNVKITARMIAITIPFKIGNSDPSLLREVFSRLEETSLDPRSCELKEYLQQVEPASSKYKDSFNADYCGIPTQKLCRIAGDLKLEGALQEAYRCFFLAYKREPHNPRLLYEMARLLYSIGSYHPRLLMRAAACLRLAAIFAKSDSKLLERIGETCFEKGDFEKASTYFTKALELEPTLFRSNIGLAEIALREGKIARVVHYYSNAARASSSPQQRFALREAEYYNKLYSDDTYFRLEFDRIQKLGLAKSTRDFCVTLLLLSWVAALLGGFFLPQINQLAWMGIISSVSIWTASSIMMLRYSQRHVQK